MSELSDPQLILGSIADPGLFELLFARHFGSVHRYLRRRLGDDLAHELASETFLQAFRTRAGYDAQRGSALPWLYAISANLMRMHYRTEERRLRAYARAGTILGTEQDTVRFEEVGDRLDAVSQGPAIAVALAGLTVGLRDVLLLHAWAGLSNDEIAEAVGCSSGAVRVRLSRARERMERQLSAEGETSYR